MNPKEQREPTLKDVTAIVREHEGALDRLERRVRQIEKVLDTADTPMWRRFLFRIDGWPRWTKVVREPKWRPWRKWWTS